MSKKKVTTNVKPGVYKTNELVESILDRISAGESVNKILSDKNMPTRKSFYSWIRNNEELSDKYEIALLQRSDAFFDEIIAIADENVADATAASRNRLRVDARKWATSKLNPKKYGDHTDITHRGNVPVTVQVVDFFTNEAKEIPANDQH